MNELINPCPPDPQPTSRHESTDVNPFWIGLCALVLLVFLAAILPIVSSIYRGFALISPRDDVSPSSVKVVSTFSGPALQVQPTANLQRIRAEEERRLSTYAWVDDEHQIARIPLDLAIRILAQQGFPVPGEAAKPVGEEAHP